MQLTGCLDVAELCSSHIWTIHDSCACFPCVFCSGKKEEHEVGFVKYPLQTHFQICKLANRGVQSLLLETQSPKEAV